MSKVPSVSVLIPCRNAERFLEATLDSVRRQSLPPEEIIVVDDGSTDRSPAIAAGFDGLVTLLQNPGHGASSARNHAMRSARGEFLQFLDADDLIEPEALATRWSGLVREQADVAISDWQRLLPVDGGWKPGPVQSGCFPDAHEPGDLQVLHGFWAPPAAILYRRNLCDRIGSWRETLPIIQDARFLLDAARVGGRFIHIPGVGARYRQHAGASLSSTDSGLFWRDVLQNALEVEPLWRDAGRLDARHRSALASAYVHAARAGFVRDRALFESAYRELKRFPGHAWGRFLRTAVWVTHLVGYPLARRWLSPWCRE